MVGHGRWREMLIVALVLVAGAGWGTAASVGRTPTGVPVLVAKAIDAAFPGAVIKGVEAELEEGVELCVVLLQQGGRAIEVEVARDGSIAEVESVLALAEVPDGVAEAIRTRTQGGEIILIERLT